MTDEKKLPDGLEDIDWDQALSEWENKTFVPEVAKDVSTDKPGTLSGGAVSKPLYRPPTVAQTLRPRVAPVPAPKAPPPPVPKPSRAPASPLFEEDDEGDGATLIAAIPRELLRPPSALPPRPTPAAPPAPKPASRGGLGQLFAREERREPAPSSRDVQSEVVTSVKASFASTDDPADLVPPWGPTDDETPDPAPDGGTLDAAPDGGTLDAAPDGGTFDAARDGGTLDAAPDGGMLDPFALSRVRAAQPTLPADEEIDDLLFQSTPPPPAEEEPQIGEAPQAPATEATEVPIEPPEGSPALLAPDERDYDPNDDTMAGSNADVARVIAEIAAQRAEPPPDEEEADPITEAATDVKARPRGAVAIPTRTWVDEKPASAWLSTSTRDALAGRATWLEHEARALGDKISRARGLLACSEIAATLGDRERAQTLAAEARDLAPSLALAHRQARSLMASPPDPEDYLEALDAEIKMTPAGPGRVHSTLLASEALRAAGDEDAAVKRLDQAARITTADVRAPVARATRALARGETASAALRLADVPELGPLSVAINLALRLRGIERKEVASQDLSANEVLLRARQALDRGDLLAAAPLVAQLGDVAGLAGGAAWLAAALGSVRPQRRVEATRWLRSLAERGDHDARRSLVARAIELDDHPLLVELVADGGSLTSAEQVALSTLLGLPLGPTDPHFDATASTAGMLPLAAAAAARSTPDAEGTERPAQVSARARRTAGSPESRALVTLGRLLASSAPGGEVETALESLGEARPPSARAVALEMAARAGRALDVSTAVEGWGAARGSSEERAVGALAAALIAERAGHPLRALEAFKSARSADPTNEGALRAIASLEQVDLVGEMNALADELGEGPRGAIARIEAVLRGEGELPEPTRADLLERAHRAAPGLPIASFLAERIARRAGDIDDVLRWIRERRAASADPIEAALDSVREALLIADREPALASERLLEAHRARPADVALRELCERMADEPADDRAHWREQRAGEATGDARALLFLEAAQEYQRSGDEEGALRSAEAAAATDAPLAHIARERAELRAGRVARLAEELLTVAKNTEDTLARREAYERLAVLDATAREDPASALLWHRSILEESPAFVPSLRYLEHHLVGEGRDDELEPIATAIAGVLRGTGAGETTAHAELAARLRMRGAEGNWDSTRDLVELAAAETEPSLWALRMLQAHARASGDDAVFLGVTLRLLDRSPRPAEAAALLVQAGEVASRLGRMEEARSLLERGAAEDPGDVVAWGLLADVRQRAGDARGAAEACESLARSSMVREHQLLAWYDAGRIWSDEVHDDERAVIALEAAAAIDVAHEDLFDRLSRIYASAKMQSELASLLERRIEGVTDPEERLAMEVRRGRILLEVGDTGGARAAFEAALAERPDDAGALSAFADLCVAQRDWDAAEQALVRLARLLPTPEEQRDVYARLGELYSRHLLNLARAEVALKEVLKRAPDDAITMEKLVDVHKRQNDPARAIELQQDLVARASTPDEKRRRVVELAAIHEQTAHDNRRAEQTLEAARREFPQDVGVLRALAEFYVRHHQAPAVNILLDRAGADARRALAAGRFTPGVFGVLATVFELRGKNDAARVTQAMLAAFEGRAAGIGGANERAFDPRLDDVLAPEVLTPALRALLLKTGEALDVAAPLDVRAMKAVAVPGDAPIARTALAVAQGWGLGAIQVLVSPRLGLTCVPVASSPAAVVLGESLLASERLAPFLVMRALKLVCARASSLARTPAAELPVLVSAWLKCFNPGWQPQGVNPAALNAVGGRVQAGLSRNLDPDVGVIALEVAGGLGTQAATLGPAALCWGNRVALLALGDPNAALDAIAATGGLPDGAPKDPNERAAWITRTPEARDLVAFAVTDAFAEARTRLGFDS
jgi:cellulose synthase operon protein C